MSIDTDTTSLFYLTWSGDQPNFTLTRPDNQVIDPAYAAANPSLVGYEDYAGEAGGAPYAAYSFTVTQAGQWQLNITATGAVDYRAFAALETSRTFTAQTDADLYQIGNTATIMANLANSGAGLSGATVTAKLTRPDAVVDTLLLADQGNGTYTANYVIPDISGYLMIDIFASGSDGGTAFTRQEYLQAAIQSNSLQLTGVYGDAPNDDNADGFYEKLDFTAQVNLATAGEYVVTADLYAGDQLVAQSGDFLTLSTGVQTLMLPFNGVAIRQSMLNGPYTITNLSLTPMDTGIIAQSGQDVLVTSAYSYTQFGAQPCYTLTMEHSGSGSDPVASPSNSTGCNANEYAAGENIDLTVLPTSGWVVSGWTGTDNDTKTGSTNTVTMPASNHTVSVQYAKVLIFSIKSTGTQDGWILESSEISKKGGTLDAKAPTFRLGDDAAKKQYLGILSFSTKSLSDNAVITKVTLKVKKQGIVGGGNPVTTFQGFLVDIKRGTFGTAALQVTDFQALLGATGKTYGPFKPVLVGGWYNLNLTAGNAYINKALTGSGLTQIRLRFKLDDNNNAIANYLSLYSSNAPTASRPQLIIEYYVP